MDAENMTIYSIVNTLTELNEVNSVKILINGREDQSFKDNKINFKNAFMRVEHENIDDKKDNTKNTTNSVSNSTVNNSKNNITQNSNSSNNVINTGNKTN